MSQLVAYCSPKLVYQTLVKFVLKKALKFIWDSTAPRLCRVTSYVKRTAMSVMKKKKEMTHEEEQAGMARQRNNISRVAAEASSVMNVIEIEVHTERYNFIKALAGISQECEETLRAEAARFRTLYMQFCEDHANHQHAMKGIMSQFHQQQQELFTQYEQLRMRMKSEHDLLCSDKITELKLSMEIEESELSES